MNDSIVIKNATMNNLKHVSVNIPKHKIVAVTFGVTAIPHIIQKV